MSEKIFVLGSNSFSGAHFVDYLMEQGCEVIGVSRSPEPHTLFLPYKWNNVKKPGHFKFHQYDLNHHLDKILKLIHDFKPDYVVNFSCQSMTAQSWEVPEHWMMTNVVSTIKFHDQLRKCHFLKKYVHISTPEVYGSCMGIVKENTNYNPSTPYAVSRAACDMSLMTFYKTYSFPVVMTRAANVYGPGQGLYRIIPRTILFFFIQKKLQLHGGGQSVRSFIHIRDVVEGTLAVARNSPPGEIYHFSNSQNISIRSLVGMIAEKMGVPFKDHVELVEEQTGKDSAYLLDNSKARTILGWKDRITLEQGIDQTIAWIKGNVEEIKKQPFDYVHKP